MDEQSSSIEKCPTCGTTRITFDPPIELTNVGRTCGQMRPGNYSSEVPRCLLAEGHDGEHWGVVEQEFKW